MLRSLSRRGITLLSTVVLGLGLTAAALASPAAAAVSTSHPYSIRPDFPIHGRVVAGCFGTSKANNLGANPCNADHVGYFALNIGVPFKTADNKPNPVPHPSVYAAGSGIVMTVTTGSPACAKSGGVTVGNQVWINHGAGIVSVYEHLSAVDVKVGAYVTPRTIIGTAGATGSRCQSNGQPVTSYLDFEVRRELGGEQNHTTNVISTLDGCSGTSGARPSSGRAPCRAAPTPAENGDPMPSTLPTTWVKVPYDTIINIPTSSTDWNCLRQNGLGSPSEPRPPVHSRSGSTAKLTWPTVTGANSYTVQMQVESGSTWTFPCYPNNQASCTYGFYTSGQSSAPHVTITGLHSGSHYRVRLSVHNVRGWGLASAWSTM